MIADKRLDGLASLGLKLHLVENDERLALLQLDVIIECQGLEYIASSGLRILLGILKGAKSGGSKVMLRNVNDDIKNVFKLTGFINLFEFE